MFIIIMFTFNIILTVKFNTQFEEKTTVLNPNVRIYIYNI